MDLKRKAGCIHRNTEPIEDTSNSTVMYVIRIRLVSLLEEICDCLTWATMDPLVLAAGQSAILPILESRAMCDLGDPWRLTSRTMTHWKLQPRIDSTIA